MKVLRLIWAIALLFAVPAVATEFAARETADVGKPWDWSVGVFNPLRLAILDGVELELHPLVFLTAPNVDVRVAHLKGQPGELRLTGEYGLSLPTGGLRLAKPLGVGGDLLPSCKVANQNPALENWCDRAPWVLVPHAGLVLSGGLWTEAARERATWTVRADVAKGIHLAGHDVRPLDAWAPVDVSLAPSLGYWRAQVRGQWDQEVLRWLRLRGELAGYVTSQPADADRSPLTLSVYVGADLRTSTHTRLTAGAIYWNSDRHEVVVRKNVGGFAEVVRVRSHEFWPTLDFIWHY